MNYTDYTDWVNATETDNVDCFHLTQTGDAEQFIETYAYSPSDTVIHIVLLPVILAVGLLGNIAFLVVVCRIPWMRTTTNSYLVNLAMADLAFLIVSIGEKLHQYSMTPFIYDDLPKGLPGCILVPFIKDFCFYSSIFLITCISLERYSAACCPLKWRRDKGRRLHVRAAKLIVGAWAIAFAVASLKITASCRFATYCLVWPADFYEDYPVLIGECRPPEVWIAYAAKSLQTVPFVISMGANMLLYVRITKAVHCTTARPNARRTPRGTSVIEAKITRMVVVTGCVFFVCLAPYEILSFLGMISAVDSNMLVFVRGMQVCRMLVHVNSAINPFIYNVANPRYRKAFRLTFSRRNCRRPTNDYHPNTAVISSGVKHQRTRNQ